MDADELGFVMLFLGAVCALPSAVLAYIVFSDDGALKRFHATPRQPIRDAAAGDVVKVAGKVAATAPLVGPFTGREVAWYRVVVTEHEYTFEGTARRERITRHLFETSQAPFTVTDESGTTARVVVDGEESFPKVAPVETVDLGPKPLPQHIQAALDARGIATRKPSGEPMRLVCVERHIAPGEIVTVIGPAVRVPSTQREAESYRDAPTELVIGQKQADQRRMFEFTNGPESDLTASDRNFLRITWALCVTTALLLAGGAYLFWA